jgi:hypothetical protein
MKTLFTPGLALLFVGCATSYKPVNWQGVQYKASTLSPEIDFAYSRNSLRDSRNPRYDRKAISIRTDIVAVRIQNKTDHPLSVKDDLTYFNGSKMVEPAEAASAIRDVRQSPGMYWLYLLMAPANIYGSTYSCDDYDCHSDFVFIPVGLIIGPILAGINAVVASSANENFRKEIQAHDLSAKVLAPGETATGYLVFPNSGTKPLMARLKTSTALPPPTAPDPFEGYEAPPARARDFR